MWPFRKKMQPSKLSDEQSERKRLAKIIAKGLCPDCEAENSMLEGPSGGMSTNIKCSECEAKFNVMGVFGVERISEPGLSKAEREERGIQQRILKKKW